MSVGQLWHCPIILAQLCAYREGWGAGGGGGGAMQAVILTFLH